MDIFISIMQVLILLGIGSIFIFKNYLFSYSAEKGKNIATKEDVAEITKKVEEVKLEYLVQLENTKLELIRQQKGFDERFAWHKELVDVSKKLSNKMKAQKYFMQQDNREAMSLKVVNELADVSFKFQELSEQSFLYAEKDTHYEIVKVISNMNKLNESFELDQSKDFTNENHPFNLSINYILTIHNLVSQDLRKMMGLDNVFD